MLITTSLHPENVIRAVSGLTPSSARSSLLIHLLLKTKFHSDQKVFRRILDNIYAVRKEHQEGHRMLEVLKRNLIKPSQL